MLKQTHKKKTIEQLLLEGKTVEEIVKLNGCKRDSVKQRKGRMIKQGILKKEFKDMNEDKNKAIIQLLEEGKTEEEILEIKHCQRDSITVARYKLNKKNRILATGEKPKEKKIYIDKGKIRALHNAKWSIKDIALDVRVSEEVVRAVLSENPENEEIKGDLEQFADIVMKG